MTLLCNLCFKHTKPTLLGCVFLDEVDGIANSLNLFSSIIRDFNVEFFFERHDQLDRVEGVSAQIVNKARAFLNFGFVNTEVLNDDFLHTCGYVTHF